jgi:hypothetical protein
VGERIVRRLLLILAGMAASLGLAASPATTAAAATATTTTATTAAAATATATTATATTATAATSAIAATACVSAAAATYRHSFNGPAGTVTVTATRSLCAGQSRSVALVSYTAAGTPGTAAGQFVYDSATGNLTATNRSLTLKVAVPGCYTQVVAFFGTAVQTELTSTGAPYGTAKLGSAASRSTGPLSWYAGGASACSIAPTVAYTYACDGTFIATLANGADANTSAVFLTGGRRIRLSAGGSTTVNAAEGATLTVRDSSFTTHVATWRSPDTGCAATLTPAPAAPAVQPSTTAPTASPSASAAPSTTATLTTEPVYDAPVAYPTFADKATTAAAKTGIGPGSVLLIVLGLLLVGTGIAAITYLVRLNRSHA